MAYDRAFSERIERIVRLVLTMLEECRDDEAAVLMFDLHKLHIDEWMLIRTGLFNCCYDPSLLSRVSTVINCSSSPALSGWDRVIPGLSRFSAHHEPTELFD